MAGLTADSPSVDLLEASLAQLMGLLGATGARVSGDPHSQTAFLDIGDGDMVSSLAADVLLFGRRGLFLLIRRGSDRWEVCELHNNVTGLRGEPVKLPASLSAGELLAAARLAGEVLI